MLEFAKNLLLYKTMMILDKKIEKANSEKNFKKANRYIRIEFDLMNKFFSEEA